MDSGSRRSPPTEQKHNALVGLYHRSQGLVSLFKVSSAGFSPCISSWQELTAPNLLQEMSAALSKLCACAEKSALILLHAGWVGVHNNCFFFMLLWWQRRGLNGFTFYMSGSLFMMLFTSWKKMGQKNFNIMNDLMSNGSQWCALFSGCLSCADRANGGPQTKNKCFSLNQTFDS